MQFSTTLIAKKISSVAVAWSTVHALSCGFQWGHWCFSWHAVFLWCWLHCRAALHCCTGCMLFKWVSLGLLVLFLECLFQCNDCSAKLFHGNAFISYNTHSLLWVSCSWCYSLCGCLYVDCSTAKQLFDNALIQCMLFNVGWVSFSGATCVISGLPVLM